VAVAASSPALIEGTRTAITDAQGTYKILDLRPGTYTVTFTQAGFSTLQWEGIELTSAFTAVLSPQMRVGPAEETVTVSARDPAIDPLNVSQKAVASRQMMDALPSDRTFISFAAMTPGMQVVGGGGLQNVGGSNPEGALMLQVHGSRINESRLFVDGMSVMSGNGTGGLNFGNFLNNAMAQEIVVNTGSLSAEFEVSGVTSNLVTTEGSNAFRGSFSGRYTTAALQGDNLSADLVARGLTSGNRINRIWDANPSAGGALRKDRLWWFSSVRHWGTYTYIAGLYHDRDPAALFYQPDPDRPAIQPVWHASADGRLTLRATPTSKVNLLYHYQFTDFGTCTAPAPTRLTAPSACAHHRNDPQWFAQASWRSALSRTAVLEMGGTITIQNSRGHRDPGASADLPAITESSSGFAWRAPPGGYGGTRNNQSNYRAALSLLMGAHTVKVGLTLLQQWRITGTDHNDSVNYTFLAANPDDLTTAVPIRLAQFAEPATFRERVNYNLGLYAQDQWTLDRLTLNLGVRADFLNAQVDAQTLPAGRFTAARAFGPIRNVPNWRDLVPRLGAAYDLSGNGRTAIKATLSRYVLGESYLIARAVNPLESTVGSAARTWNDSFHPVGDPRRGNFEPDCDLKNVAANGECGAANPNTFGQTVVRTQYDQALTRGFGVRPYNWAASLGIEHELLPGVSVSGSYVRRWYGNFNNIRRNLAVSNADFTQYCITAPLDPRLPGGGGHEMCGFYDISVAKFGETNILITGARGLRHEDVYDGFDFTFSARLPNRARLTGGLSLGRERTNTCYTSDDRALSVTATSPRTTPFCDVRPPMRPNLKLQGVYPLPWWGVQTAATFQSLPGPQLLAQQETTNAQILPSLGRNLASCGSRPVCNATVLLDLLPPGTLYGDRVNQIDLRISRTVRVGRAVVRPSVSVYNLLNANPVLRYNNRYGPGWPAPTAVLTARFLDFGVQIDF
jgi:hypothetical protein